MNLILERIAQLQQHFTTATQIDSYRLFHGRGRTYPGLEFVTVDYFQPVLLVTLFAEPPAHWVAGFMAAASPLLAPVITTVVLQRRYLSGAPSEVLVGNLPEHVFARRGKMRFNLHIAQQQNSGFFLDMEQGRRWLEQHASGKHILNLFAYTCAFSVVAVAAGAKKVMNVDMSSAALNLGRANHTLNGLDKYRSEFMAENIMKSWGRIKRRGPYDLVIIDPPSYQKGSFIALKDYGKVIRRLCELIPKGGLVLACLNAPELDEEFLKQQFAEQCPHAEFIERLAAHADFPDIDPAHQLKLLVFNVAAVE